MRKLFGLLTIASLVFVGKVYAASNVSIRLEQPKTPTNQNSFSITFTALDILNRQITVKCFKQGPNDNTATQFGSDIVLTSGGNTANCQVTSSQMNDNGSYTFSVTATAGSDSASDQTTLVYNTSGPGDPKDYSKTKVSNCTYNIHFKTAADNGKTVKVEIYRSENTSFNTDSGTQVGTVNAGSDEAHDFPNDVPNCDKTYYYAIRSFDSAGNGSSVVGDNVTVNTTTTVKSTPGSNNGAIPVGQGQSQVTGNGQTLGEATKSGSAKDTASETPSENPESQSQGTAPIGFKKIALIGGLVILAAAILYARRRK